VKHILPILFLFSFAVLLTQKIHAVSITINSYPSSISSEIFNIQASISGATNATNYLRLDLYKEGTNNYFGETFNGSDWYTGAEGKNYFPIQIQSSSASATIQGQLGNPSINSYPGPGIYKLKLRRYTSSGSQSQNDQQTPVEIQIDYIPPTPTPTDSPTPTITTTPVPTATPTNTPTKTPTPTYTLTPTLTKNTVIASSSAFGGSDSAAIHATISFVLGESTGSASTSSTFWTNEETATDDSQVRTKSKTPYKTIFLAGLGLSCCFGGLLYLRLKSG
jgi:hypothetical protein